MIGTGDNPVTVTVPLNGTESNAFYIGNSRFGSVQCPAALTGTTLNYKVSNSSTFTDAMGDDGSAALSNQTVAANSLVIIPSNVMHARFAKLVVASQAAARTFIVNLKG